MILSLSFFKAEAELSQIKSEISEKESSTVGYTTHNPSLNQSLSSSVLESREIGDRYEKIKAEFFKEKSRNREIIDGLQDRLDEMQRQYDARSVTRKSVKKD